MHVLALLLLAAPFWEVKAPEQWTAAELESLLTDSPWAQMADAGRHTPNSPPVRVYIASAKPIRLAEHQVRIRTRSSRERTESLLEQEYREFVEQNEGKHIIVAVQVNSPHALDDAEESRRMEQETVLKIGKRKYKMTGHFPPSALDPYVRIVFPRDIRPEDRKMELQIYVPSLPSPYREVEFSLREMLYKGEREL